MVMDTTTMSDADALLSASATPTSNTGPVLTMALPASTPVYPVPGGSITTPDMTSPQVNVATVDTAPLPDSGFDPKALLWLGAGIGTAWLLSRSDRTVSGPGKTPKWLVPALVIGAGAAWYFFGDKIAAAVSPGTDTPAGGAAADQQRAALQQWATGNAAALAAVNSADAATLDIWYRLVGMWNNNVSTQVLYSTYPNGTTGAPWDKSIGKWWENFKLAHNI